MTSASSTRRLRSPRRRRPRGNADADDSFVIVDDNGDTAVTVFNEEDVAKVAVRSNGEGDEFKSSIILSHHRVTTTIKSFQREQTKSKIGNRYLISRASPFVHAIEGAVVLHCCLYVAILLPGLSALLTLRLECYHTEQAGQTKQTRAMIFFQECVKLYVFSKAKRDIFYCMLISVIV